MMGGESFVVLDSTRAYCPDCGTTEHALITAGCSGVYMERICPSKGAVAVKIAEESRWYMDRVAEPRAIEGIAGAGESARGCPFDCGPCRNHTASLRLPVVSVTNLCNLDCPICFTFNRPDLAYLKSPAEMKVILDHLRKTAGDLELINITGGEPTLHPELFDIIKVCKEAGVGRITVNSNGLRIAEDEGFAQKLAEAGVQVVLSLDTLDPEKSVIIHGKDITRQKLAALEVMERLGIPATILSVCIGGVNEEEVAGLVRRYLPRSFVRGVTIQNMTFTGKNGKDFEPRIRVTIDAVEKYLEAYGGFSRDDFFPLGSYHPLCYSAAYYIAAAGRLIPLSRLVDKKILTAATAKSYVLGDSEELHEAIREGIDNLWAKGEDEGTIAALRKFVGELYPAGVKLTGKERRKRAESMIRMVYIHPHMDEDNFDIARVSHCGDLVPDESGAMIPACSYNLLYRQKDSRFWVDTA